MSDKDAVSFAAKEESSGSENNEKNIEVNENLKEDPLDDYGKPDRLKNTKSLVIRKTEIMAKQYEASLVSASIISILGLYLFIRLCAG